MPSLRRPPFKRFKFAINALLTSIAFCTTLTCSAYAQGSIFTIPESQNASYADVGVAGIIRDTYIGSTESETRVAPYIKAEYKGRLFFKPGLGAGLYAIKNDRIRLSFSGNIAFGRDTADTPFRDQGFDPALFELDDTVTATIAGRYNLPIGVIDVIGTIPVGGDLDGQRIDALFTTQIRPLKKLRITPGVRSTYQSSGWINSIYGLDGTQAAALGTETFDLGGQFATIGAHAIAYYQLPNNYEFISLVNYSRLIGDVQDSPLVGTNNGLTAAIAIAKKF